MTQASGATPLRQFGETLQWIAVAAWAGSLWTVGLLVAPTLFSVLEDRALAGRVAGVLFDRGAWIGLACAACILGYRWLRAGAAASRQAVVWVTLAMLLLTLAGKFGVQPTLAGLREQMLAGSLDDALYRQRFGLWHGVAGVLYLMQCLLALLLTALLVRSRARDRA